MVAAAAQTPENLRARRQFQDDKFGMFIHWGPYSLLAGEWKGHRVPVGTEAGSRPIERAAVAGEPSDLDVMHAMREDRPRVVVDALDRAAHEQAVPGREGTTRGSVSSVYLFRVAEEAEIQLPHVARSAANQKSS